MPSGAKWPEPAPLGRCNFSDKAWKRRKRCLAKAVEGQRLCAHHKDQKAQQAKRRYHRLRNDILTYYGDRCECCGETERSFLAIEHVHGGGGKRKVGGQMAEYVRIWNDKPADIRILCHNCNQGRESNDGICPHDLARIKAEGIFELPA